MIKLKKLLMEGISDIVYHKTYIHSAYEILKNDEFKLSSTAGSIADKRGDKLYFFSTARNLSSSYFSVGEFTVLFKLDGRKLGQKYKGFPVEYWGLRQKGTSEEEDRIVTDDPYIKNATKYIDELHILLPSKYEKDLDFDDKIKIQKTVGRNLSYSELNRYRGEKILKVLDDAYSSLLRKIILECKKNDIEFFAYIDKQNMKYMQKRNAINLTDINLDGKHTKDGYYGGFRMGYVDDVIELYYTPTNSKKLSKSGKEYLNNLKRYWGFDYNEKDIIRSLEADIHNNRSSGRKSIERISKLIRKYGSIKDLLTHIFNKWNGK